MQRCQAGGDDASCSDNFEKGERGANNWQAGRLAGWQAG